MDEIAAGATYVDGGAGGKVYAAAVAGKAMLRPDARADRRLRGISTQR